MDMTNESCRKFVEVLASNAPRLAAAVRQPWWGCGWALGNMVGSLTVGKKSTPMWKRKFSP